MIDRISASYGKKVYCMDDVYFPFGEREILWLCSRDPQLGAVISHMEKPKRKLLPDLFSGLVFYIISQQVSAKAAETEWTRFQELFSPIRPENICRFIPEEIQRSGTTLRRAAYIRQIAELLADGSLNLGSLTKTDDATFIREITKLSGIGEWTAQMLLIHVLKRPDVISFKDLAVLRGMRMVYQVPDISREFFEQKKDLYSPYSTTASIYFWAISTGKASNAVKNQAEDNVLTESQEGYVAASGAEVFPILSPTEGKHS